MPNDKDFIGFVIGQVQAGYTLTYRHMFGGTTLYMNSKVVGLICDNQLFVKPTEAGRAYIGAVVEAPPYKGAKNSFLIEEEIEDPSKNSELESCDSGAPATGSWQHCCLLQPAPAR